MMKKLFVLTALVMLVLPASGCGCFPRLFRGERAQPCCPQPCPCEPTGGCACEGAPMIGPAPMAPMVGPPVGVVPGPAG
jgi:hypothetical protein